MRSPAAIAGAIVAGTVWKVVSYQGCFGGLMLGLILAMHAHADDRGGVARQQRTEARGWLQLERDQAVFRERVEPLSPSASRGLEIRERMERNDKRALDLRQRQRRDYGSPAAGWCSAPGPGG